MSPRRPRRPASAVPVLLVAALGGVGGLGACMPAHRPPPRLAQVTAPTAWRDTANAGAAVAGPTVDAGWWRAFGDSQLTALVDSALARNTSVLAAVSRVDEARAAIGLAGAARLPAVDVGVGTSVAQSLSPATGRPQESTVLQPQVQVAWDADVFGRLRSLGEAARLQYAASRTDRDAVTLAVAATTARAYLTLLSLDAQLRVTRETVRSRAEALRIAEDQARTGWTSQLQLAQAQAEYEAVAQQVPALERAVRQQENALRVLAGELPGGVRRGSLDSLAPPPVPAVLPSAILRRRPDLARAELSLAAADATLASRRAEFLPSVRLSTAAGRLLVDALDYDPVSIWSLGSSVLAPVFSGGRLTAQVDAAAARRDQAALAYRGATLTAFAEVENALTGVRRLEEQLARVRAREAILQRTLALARDRYRAGYASYLEELDAQRNLFSAQREAIVLREGELTTLVTLYETLGGGWTGSEAAARAPTPPAR